MFGGQFEPLCGCLCFFCHCVSFFVHFECLRNDFPRVRGHLETLSSYFTSHSEHFAALNVFWLFWVFWMTLTFHSESQRRFERRKTLKFALWCHIKQHDPVSSAHPYQGRVQTEQRLRRPFLPCFQDPLKVSTSPAGCVPQVNLNKHRRVSVIHCSHQWLLSAFSVLANAAMWPPVLENCSVSQSSEAFILGSEAAAVLQGNMRQQLQHRPLVWSPRRKTESCYRFLPHRTPLWVTAPHGPMWLRIRRLLTVSATSDLSVSFSFATHWKLETCGCIHVALLWVSEVCSL